MDITEQQVGRVWLVTARGRLDGESSGTFTRRMGELTTGVEPRLLVDFSGVDFVSSAGLRAVLMLVKRMKAVKGALALCEVQAPVRQVFDLTGFTEMIEVHPERTAALAALS